MVRGEIAKKKKIKKSIKYRNRGIKSRGIKSDKKNQID